MTPFPDEFESSIQSRVAYEDYAAVPAVSITRLKELRRSAQHYRYALTHPKETDPLRLGTASHVATLEPERFASQFAVWDRQTSAAAMAPRRGQYWDAFCAENVGRTVLTPDQNALANAIAKAVRSDPIAMPYLESGEPEVSMTWMLGERQCKGRADWITRRNGCPVVVGLKTARDCRHFAFGSQSAKLGYHLQWAFYFDAYRILRGDEPLMVEIVVENKPPHAVVVYRIPTDIIDQGRDEYEALLRQLEECERTNTWPGPAQEEQILTLPSWVYQAEDDLSDLGLEITP